MEGDLTWGGEHTIQYTDANYRIVHLKPIFIIQCHSNKFNKRGRIKK